MLIKLHFDHYDKYYNFRVTITENDYCCIPIFIFPEKSIKIMTMSHLFGSEPNKHIFLHLANKIWRQGHLCRTIVLHYNTVLLHVFYLLKHWYCQITIWLIFHWIVLAQKWKKKRPAYEKCILQNNTQNRIYLTVYSKVQKYKSRFLHI